MTEPTTSDRASGLAPTVILALFAMGLALAAVVALVAFSPSVVAFDPTTPGGTAQAWLQGLVDEDPAVLDLVDPALGCTEVDLQRVGLLDTMHVLLVDETITGSTAVVDLEVTEAAGADPIDGDGWNHDEQLRLRRADDGDGWLLTQLEWPLYGCGGGR